MHKILIKPLLCIVRVRINITIKNITTQWHHVTSKIWYREALSNLLSKVYVENKYIGHIGVSKNVCPWPGLTSLGVSAIQSTSGHPRGGDQYSEQTYNYSWHMSLLPNTGWKALVHETSGESVSFTSGSCGSRMWMSLK